MPATKRKAPAAAHGRPAKRSASGISTPISLASDDSDFSGDDDDDSDMNIGSAKSAPRKYDSEWFCLPLSACQVGADMCV